MSLTSAHMKICAFIQWDSSRSGAFHSISESLTVLYLRRFDAVVQQETFFRFICTTMTQTRYLQRNILRGLAQFSQNVDSPKFTANSFSWRRPEKKRRTKSGNKLKPKWLMTRPQEKIIRYCISKDLWLLAEIQLNPLIRNYMNRKTRQRTFLFLHLHLRRRLTFFSWLFLRRSVHLACVPTGKILFPLQYRTCDDMASCACCTTLLSPAYKRFRLSFSQTSTEYSILYAQIQSKSQVSHRLSVTAVAFLRIVLSLFQLISVEFPCCQFFPF